MPAVEVVPGTKMSMVFGFPPRTRAENNLVQFISAHGQKSLEEGFGNYGGGGWGVGESNFFL